MNLSFCTVSLLKVLFGIQIVLLRNVVSSLTGHVCRHQKEETYRVSTNKAFLCSERYTTSCGHLDWRRCTRYRVQTCYTPSERYAKRYREIEECCPGWLQAAGSCNIPVCHGLCQNGGVCSESGAVPHCSCLPGFYGDVCQHMQPNHIGNAPSNPDVNVNDNDNDSTSFPAWMVVVVVTTSVVGVVIVGVLGFCLFKKSLTALSRSTTVHPMATPSHTQPSNATIGLNALPSTSRPRQPTYPTQASAPSYEESECVPSR